MSGLYTNIKNRRKELKMTQTELAQKLGYSDKSMISHIENGDIDLSRTRIMAFAEALQTTPSALMGWDDDEPSLDDIPQSVLPLMDAAKDLDQKDIEYLIDLAKRLKGDD